MWSLYSDQEAWMLFSCAEPADTILVLWVVAQVLYVSMQLQESFWGF